MAENDSFLPLPGVHRKCPQNGLRIGPFHTGFSASLPIGDKIRSGLAFMRASRLTTSKHYRYSSACAGILDRERLCGNAGKNYSMPHAVATLGTNSLKNLSARSNRKSAKSRRKSRVRPFLTGGDRRSIAKSDQVRAIIEDNPAMVAELAELADDDDWLVSQRALDLLEKLAHDHVEWIEPYKRVFLGSCAGSDKWEVRLQIVRALPLFQWAGKDAARAKAILLENVSHPQTFVKAWALDSLATFAVNDARLMPAVRTHLNEFEQAGSKALQTRARHIRQRLGERQHRRGRRS